MTRTRVRRRRLTLVVMVALALAPVAGRALGSVSSGPTAPTTTHVVREGETLWSIARAKVGPEGDPRPLVQEIRELNHVEPASLLPGSRLVLPALDH